MDERSIFNPDKRINKNDIRDIEKSHWPWKETHIQIKYFLKDNKKLCVWTCSETFNVKGHMKFLNNQTFESWILNTNLWCDNCFGSLFDHYTPDDCGVYFMNNY